MMTNNYATEWNQWWQITMPLNAITSPQWVVQVLCTDTDRWIFVLNSTFEVQYFQVDTCGDIPNLLRHADQIYIWQSSSFNPSQLELLCMLQALCWDAFSDKNCLTEQKRCQFVKKKLLKFILMNLTKWTWL